MSKQGNFTVTRRQISFWLSLLFHLLLLLSLFNLFTAPPQLEETHKTPNYFVPAYTYSGSIKPSPAPAAVATTTPKAPAQQNTQNQKVEEEPAQPKKELALKPIKPKASPAKHITHQPSLIAASFNMLQQEQFADLNTPKEEDPIYLVGDDSQPADPLIKMLGHALSAHFSYPETAGRLGIRGKVIVELVLHPEGFLSDVHIIRSSDNHDLDAAALYAANSAPRVEGANRFLDKPKRFVVGFVYY